MSFKEKLQRKIEKNTVKSELSWTDKEGYIHTEKVLLKRSKMPLIGDWGRIYPPLREDGSIHWTNLLFGGKKNLIRTLIILGIVTMMLFGYLDLLNQLAAIKGNVCYQSCTIQPQFLIP